MFFANEKHRVKKGALATTKKDGPNGLFKIRLKKVNDPFIIIASDGAGWEHVSVSLPNRCPTWEEMVYIKNQFWARDDCVIQFHPPESEYINNHPYCLHLWRQIGATIAMPDKSLVGI